MAQLFAGTSGFAYPQWKPRFYPAERAAEEVPRALRQPLERRRDQLHLPADSLRDYDRKLGRRPRPEGFSFSIKAHQRITHIAAAEGCPRAGGILSALDRSAARDQTAGRGAVSVAALPAVRCCRCWRTFWRACRKDLRYAFEFRHASWQNDEVYRALEKHNACYCLAESEKLEPPDVSPPTSSISGCASPSTPPRIARPFARQNKRSAQMRASLSSSFSSMKTRPKERSTPKRCLQKTDREL